MLDVLRQGQRWIMGIVILVVGAVFVFFIGTGGPLSGGRPPDVVLDLDGKLYPVSDFERIRELQQRELRERFGDQFDASALGRQLDDMALQQLLRGALIAHEAEAVGLRVSEAELRDAAKTAGFFEGGRERYLEIVEQNFGNEAGFKRVLTGDLLSQKFVRLLTSGAIVTEAEARDAFVRGRETVSLALVVLDTKKPRPGAAAIDDAAVQALLASDEARVRALYDASATRFHQPERVRARHILVRVEKTASEEDKAKARAKAEEARKRLEAGEDFATLAGELSDDPGSKAQGGDLGFFMRGQMVPPFEAAAFGLEPGALSQVIETDFGFHVLRLEEKQAASERSFDEVKLELAREALEADQAGKLAQETADALAKAVSGGASLEDAARKEKLTLERPPPLRRRPDGFVPGVGASPKLLDTAFGIPVENPSSPRIFRVEDKLVMVQVLGRGEPSQADISKELPAFRTQLLEDKKQRVLLAWTDARQRALEAEGKIALDTKALGR